jgi:hypothetical protein
VKCSVKECEQLVLNKEEQKRKHPLCYHHAKCRDGLYGPPNTYSITDDEREISSPCSNPVNYKRVSDYSFWRVDV